MEDSSPHYKQFEDHFSTVQRQNKIEQRLLVCVESFMFQLQSGHGHLNIVVQIQPQLFQGCCIALICELDYPNTSRTC